MTYVDRTLVEDEAVLGRGKFHWIFNLVSVLWAVLLGWLLIGLYIAGRRTIEELTTEIAVTNHRFIYKTGLFSRQTMEFAVDRIESVELDQDLIGRLFGLGRLTIRGSGIGEVEIPPIADPIGFRRALLQARHVARGEPAAEDVATPSADGRGQFVVQR